MAGIGIIANPHSKLNKRNPKRQQLLSYIAGEQGRVEVTNNLDDLARAAKDFKARDIDILAINGGDGTIGRTLSALIEVYGPTPLPKVALLRGGTMNMLAGNLGIFGSPEQNLYQLIEGHSDNEIGKAHIIPLRTLKIGGVYGFLFADGLSSAFLKEFYRNKTATLGTARLILRVLLSSLHQGALFSRLVQSEIKTIIYDDFHKTSCSSISILCSYVEKIPFGFKLFPVIRHLDECFSSLNVTLSKSEFLRLFLPLLLRNQGHSQIGKVSVKARKIRVIYEKPPLYTMDGELYQSESNELLVSSGPMIDFIKLF